VASSLAGTRTGPGGRRGRTHLPGLSLVLPVLVLTLCCCLPPAAAQSPPAPPTPAGVAITPPPPAPPTPAPPPESMPPAPVPPSARPAEPPPVPPPGPGTSQIRSDRIHMALNNAVESNRRGDYEQAAVYLEQAKAGQGDLSPGERQDLESLLRSNTIALQARRQGADQVRQAQQALRQGHKQEAADLLRPLVANQYLTPADKEKVRLLNEQVRTRAPLSTAAMPWEEGTGNDGAGSPAAQATLARGKLQQARAMLAGGNFDAAEQLVREADLLKVTYAASEDTPRKVHEEISRARSDPKFLLGAARDALKRGDLDRADLLAAASEKAESMWSLHWWGDSPGQVHKDVQAARAAHSHQPGEQSTANQGPAKDAGQTAAKQPAGWNDPPHKATASNLGPDAVVQVSGSGAGGGVTQAVLASGPGQAGNTGDLRTTVPAPTPAAADHRNDNTEQARTLLRQATQALQGGDPGKAAELAKRARDLKPSLQWWDTTPESVLADVERARAAKGRAAGPAPANVRPGDRDDPQDLLKEGRIALAAGRLDEATRLGNRARAASVNRGTGGGRFWGLFDDSPDKLLQDVEQARAARNREESSRVLTEGRHKLEKGDLDGATQAAYQAQRLHGDYTIWDLGDRPSRLLADVQSARERLRKNPQPPGPAAELTHSPDQGGKAAPRPADTRLSQADHPDPGAPPPPPAGPTAMGPLPPAPPPGAAVPPGTPAPPPMPGTVDVAGSALPPPPAPPQGPFPAPAPTNDLARQRALQLLAEARQLQARGLLVEARQKALEAQGTRAVFGPYEDSPEHALIQLSSLGQKKIDMLVQEAGDYAATAGQNAANYQKAEQDLRQARQLAAAFGLYLQPIDEKWQALRGMMAAKQMPAAPAAPTGGAPDTVQQVAGVVERPARAPGLVQLEEARRYLRSGDTVSARRLATTVYTNGTPALQGEALTLLRSIDAEEFGQHRIAAQAAFRAGMSAYGRGEFAQAANIFRTIDVRLLEPQQKQTLGQIYLTAEMQPGQIQRTDLRTPAPAGTAALPAAPVPAAPRQGPGGADIAHVRVTDGPQEAGQDLLKQAQAMQDIRFQKLRAEGLEAQREAAERFRAGDSAAAIDILQDYEGKLTDVQLDTDRVALLRRPVDARLLQFKTLAAQRDYEKQALAQQVNGHSQQGQLAMVRMNKQKKVEELLEQYRGAYKEAKYREAEMYAQAAHDLDPDNAAASAAVMMSQTQQNLTRYRSNKKKMEQAFVDYLDDAEDPGDEVNVDDPIKFNKDHTIRAARDRKKWSHGVPILSKTDKEKEIEARLNNPVNLNFTDAPLEQVLADLRAQQGINIDADTASLQNEGISLKQPVTITLENISLKSALELLLQKVHLTYLIDHEALVITTINHAKGQLETRTYQVADLVIPVESPGMPKDIDFHHALQEATHPNHNYGPLGGTVPFQGAYNLPAGQQAGGGGATPVGGTGSAGAALSTMSGGGSGGGAVSVVRQPGQTAEDMLIRLITNTIKPQSWSEMGGPGTIDYFPPAMALIINQSPDVQEQIQQLLDQLRAAQDLEVAVEVRFISLDEGFYEYIGVDFNVNFLTQHNNLAFQPQITGATGLQDPAFIQQFLPRNFVAGLTPAGTFTQDLNIPLTNTSFGMAVPPFGGFPNMPGQDGGISIGLAFLSEIQVFLFMEAAQGDQRTNVMQAPKLTMFNGQTAFLSVTDQQFFVTNVNLIQSGGQFSFIPTNQPIPTGGVNLSIQPVVSADRRFVRLSLQPTLTNLASATVAMFPMVFAVTPQFEGGFTGQPVLFTQFVQQPVFNSITVGTTVNVPDGGTVLLGGLKRLSEGRNEFGPPVLSKIPYLDRLFRNVGFGRETESLMMMVTPRIIINSEEEFRATGVGVPPGP
jgi:type II secretory pathway component GspD/PulD (secretin)